LRDKTGCNSSRAHNYRRYCYRDSRSGRVSNY